MEEIHKQALVKCRRQLVSDVFIEVLWDHLIQEGVITIDMKKYIQGQASLQNESATSILLDNLPKRGRAAFSNFCKCLGASGHEYLQQELEETVKSLQKAAEKEAAELASLQTSIIHSQPEVRGRRPELEGLPYPGDIMDLELQLCNNSDKIMQNIFLTSCNPRSEIYKMTQKTRGHLLLVINSDYSLARKNSMDLRDRDASDCDRTLLLQLFPKLYFEIITKVDLKARALMDAVKAEGKSDHSNFDCFICIISAHGSADGIYGTDGTIVPLDGLFESFDGDKCTTLAGKPKLFFIQASRGGSADKGVSVNIPSSIPLSPEELINEYSCKDLPSECLPALNDLGMTDANFSMRNAKGIQDNMFKVPSKADFFVAFASPKGYQAFRNTIGGSWFLRLLVIIFKKFSHKYSLMRMMTKVNNVMVQAVSSGGNKQTCFFWSTLTKEVYFFPGLCAEER